MRLPNLDQKGKMCRDPGELYDKQYQGWPKQAERKADSMYSTVDPFSLHATVFTFLAQRLP